MEFIIGQIFSNSIKYKKESEPGVINIFVTECAVHDSQSKAEYLPQDEQNEAESASHNGRIKQAAVRNKERSNKKITLHIRDNGIGIAQGDLRRVWNKTFTGQNGRRRAKSTGMGLYIVKGLCDKLGNDICIESQEGEYTDVQITFQTCNLLSR